LFFLILGGTGFIVSHFFLEAVAHVLAVTLFNCG